MHEMGLVHVLAEPGCGEEAVKAYIAKNGRKQSGHSGIFHASRLVNPLSLAELEAVVEIWADAALCLSDSDLKLMKRLADAQTRLATV
jgi:DSF synthase